MEKTLSIMIVEDDKLACDDLTRCIAQYEDLQVCAICSSSTEAETQARYFLPNVIILDLELHQGGGNGLMFLDHLLENPLSMDPFILVTTNNMSRIILDQAKALGADFTLTKYEEGYCAQYVIDNIRMLRNAILRKNTTTPLRTGSPAAEEQLLRNRICRELDLVGIKPKAKGYDYLVDAIFMVLTRNGGNLSRILADKYKKSTTSIERAMQNAIKQAWTTNCVDDLLQHYTARIHPDKGYPTMMEFIYYYEKKLRLEIDTEKIEIRLGR